MPNLPPVSSAANQPTKATTVTKAPKATKAPKPTKANQSPTHRPRRRVGRPTGAVPVTDRDQLLDAAERAIAHSGPGTSMEAIAAEAAVTKPVLYQYVGNKDALVDALAERHMVRINAAVAHATRHRPHGRDRVRALVAAFFGVVAPQPNLYLYFTSAGASENSPHRSMAFADQTALPLAGVLTRQRNEIGADPGVAATWAYGTVGLLHYVTLWWIREPVLTLDEIVDHVTELMWCGLGPSSAATTAASAATTATGQIATEGAQP